MCTMQTDAAARSVLWVVQRRSHAFLGECGFRSMLHAGLEERRRLRLLVTEKQHLEALVRDPVVPMVCSSVTAR